MQKNISFNETDKYHSDWRVRQEAFRVLGWTEEAMKDEMPYIRIEAFRVLGYSDLAKSDKSTYIRLKAYHILGYSESAHDDPNPFIRKWAFIQKNNINKIQTKYNDYSHRSRSVNLWRFNYSDI